MTPKQRELVQQLFEEFVDRPRRECEAALLQRSVDQVVGAEVLGLLAIQPVAMFADEHVGELAIQLTDAVEEDATPERIGPYVIRELCGEGGMGRVYLAEQSEPIRRQVAIKVIKLGMDSRQILQRFEHERQALARMSHDAIARVFDAGTTERGQPYFVMEYVGGESIVRFCDRQAMSIRDRVRLLQKVCAGVQHAHQKGVLHRDLKPSNILVAGNAESQSVKIIDFGLARAIANDADGTIATLLTSPGEVVGTPEYMAPEQAVGDVEHIDTRADVYSLGVLLYEMLTGSLPFRDYGRGSRTPHEVLRRMQEDDPRSPSSRVKSADHDATACAAARGVSARQLSRTLQGDLDAVVLKALAKDPERRYESANALADDLRRLLADEPVMAQRPSSLYFASKVLRRYRVQAIAVGVVLLTAVAGAVFAANYAFEARAQTTRAEDNLARWSRLADLRRLDALIAEADELWPALPHKIPALQGWLARARAFGDSLASHRATLTELRASARHDPDEVDASDRKFYEREHTRIAEIGHELARLEGDADPRAEPQRQRLLAERALLAERVTHRRTWQFDNAEVAFRHRHLTELVERLTTFVATERTPVSATIADVAWRLDAARRLREEANDPEFLRAWQTLIADVRRPNSVYRGLVIEPIPGVRPIGVDADSELWELVHTETGEMPQWVGEPLGHGRIELSPDNSNEGIVLVLIPGGSFRQGARGVGPGHAVDEPNVDPIAVVWEWPVHDAQLAPFLLGKFEVTQGQWQRSFPTNPSYYELGSTQGATVISLRHPVTNVHWSDCRDAVRQWGLLLPTESQWEYACRARTSSAFFTGNDFRSLHGYANIADESRARFHAQGFNVTEGFDDGFSVHAPVGVLKANPFGLHDMIGNVREWTRDELIMYFMFPPQDGDGYRGLWTGVPRKDVAGRGGSFQDHANYSRCASRLGIDPTVRSAATGFRVSRALPPIE